MSLSAVVPANCTVSATPLSFNGSAKSDDATIDGTANINVQCSSTTSFSVVLDHGVNPSGNQRRMVNENSRFLPYDVYSDASRSNEWRDVSGQVDGAGITSMTAYGRISNLSLSTEPGSYQDTVTVTVNF